MEHIAMFLGRLIIAARRLSESCQDNEGSEAAEGGEHEQSHDHDAKRELDRLLAQWDACTASIWKPETLERLEREGKLQVGSWQKVPAKKGRK